MTEIAGVGAASAGLFRSANIQNEEQQQNQQTSLANQDDQDATQRRIEQVSGGSDENGVGNPGNQSLDFSADDVQQAQVNAVVDNNQRVEEFSQERFDAQTERQDEGVQISLSQAAQDAQARAVATANLDTQDAEQSLQEGIAQTDSSLDSEDFTRIIDDNRAESDNTTAEARATRELGRVLDTFA